MNGIQDFPRFGWGLPPAQTRLARLARLADSSMRAAKPRARRLAEAGARKGASPLALYRPRSPASGVGGLPR